MGGVVPAVFGARAVLALCGIVKGSVADRNRPALTTVTRMVWLVAFLIHPSGMALSRVSSFLMILM
jgi:hypothetical protein